MPAGEIPKQKLFERLAEGHAAGITVVTPNRRLAQVLRAEFDAFQVSNGKTVWEDADILPLASFAERRYDDSLYADGGDKLPLLLSPSQERELWEEAIRGSKWSGVLLDVPRTAKGAMDAWRIAQSWRIAGALEKFEGNEDVRAFADWAKAYARRCKKEGLTDSAALLDLPLEVKKPKLLVAYAFDIVPAQTKDFFGRFEFSSCKSERKKSKSAKISFASPAEELETAARWARARLESGAKRIGVVIPELEQRRREVDRVFTRVFGHVMGSPAPFNLSLGEPLSGYPLVAFALSLLEFSIVEKKFEDVSRLIRSPFLGGAETGMAARALLDARLRREAPAVLSLPKLISFLDQSSSIRELLESIYKITSNSSQSPHGWADHFLAILKVAGFPGERALDSAEFQTRVRFHEVLSEFSRLSMVSSVFSSRKALTQLRSPVPARVRRRAGAGAGAAGIRGPRVRCALAERPHGRRLAAALAAESLPAGRPAENGRHPGVLGRRLAGARPAHHRGLERRGGRGRLLLAAPHRGPRPLAEPASSRHSRTGNRRAFVPELARFDFFRS
jgi:ATP-dependent helicase/nuclease subunit B